MSPSNRRMHSRFERLAPALAEALQATFLPEIRLLRPVPIRSFAALRSPCRRAGETLPGLCYSMWTRPLNSRSAPTSIVPNFAQTQRRRTTSMGTEFAVRRSTAAPPRRTIRKGLEAGRSRGSKQPLSTSGDHWSALTFSPANIDSITRSGTKRAASHRILLREPGVGVLTKEAGGGQSDAGGMSEQGLPMKRK